MAALFKVLYTYYIRVSDTNILLSPECRCKIIPILLVKELR